MITYKSYDIIYIVLGKCAYAHAFLRKNYFEVYIMLFSLAFEFPKTLDEFMGNTLLFYGTIGAVVLLIAIIIICSCVSKSKKKKKNADAPVEEIVQAPVAEVVTPAPVAEAEVCSAPVYEQPIVVDEPTVIPAAFAPVDEGFSYEEHVAEAPTLDSLDLIDQIEDEPIVAPIEEKPRKTATKTKVVKKVNASSDDDGWATAKINVPSKKAEEAVVAPVEEAPKAEKAKPAPKKKAVAKPQVVEQPIVAEAVAVEAEDDKPKVVGKYIISSTNDYYQYSLYANNGQLLYESRAYATLNSCKAGIDTFKKNIVSGEYRIDVDKNGGYKYIFKKGNSIYIGESYRTAKAAENSAESVKRFALISNIVIE